MVMFHSYVSLPEGKQKIIELTPWKHLETPLSASFGGPSLGGLPTVGTERCPLV